jgi:hypothetical protein
MLRSNRFLWTLQVLLAALFIFAGGFKLVAAPEQMQPSTLPVAFLRFIGAVELLGGIGLIVPWATGIRPLLTAYAACGLVVIMIGAVIISAIEMGVATAILPFVTGLLLLLVVRGRRPAPRPAAPAGV